MRNSTQIFNRNMGINRAINCTYVNLRILFFFFLCDLGSIHGHFTWFCGFLFVWCCFPTSSKVMQVTMCSLNSQISMASKNCANSPLMANLAGQVRAELSEPNLLVSICKLSICHCVSVICPTSKKLSHQDRLNIQIFCILI